MKFETFDQNHERLPQPEIATETEPREDSSGINEDTVLVDEEHKTFGVFDGVGGSEAGEAFSRRVSDLVKETFSLPGIETKLELAREIEAEKIMADQLYAINHRIIDEMRRSPGKSSLKPGGGTTGSIVKIIEKGAGVRWAIIGSVGDSRVYRFTKAKEFTQVTEDDKNYPEGVAEKLDTATQFNELNEVEKAMFYSRNVVNKVFGIDFETYSKDKPGAFATVVTLEAGDSLLITSDGVHDNLTRDQIKQILGGNQPESPQEVVSKIISESKKVSRMDPEKNIRAKKDDMSAVVIRG